MYCEEYFDGILQNLTTHTDTPDKKEQQHLPGNVTYRFSKKNGSLEKVTPWTYGNIRSEDIICMDFPAIYR